MSWQERYLEVLNSEVLSHHEGGRMLAKSDEYKLGFKHGFDYGREDEMEKAKVLVKALDYIGDYKMYSGPNPEPAFKMAREALVSYRKAIGEL